MKNIVSSHNVPVNISGIRLTDYLLEYGEPLLGRQCTRNFVKKTIKAGNIMINGCQANTGSWVETGQRIDYILSDSKPAKIYQLEIPVIFEDEHLAVINKPAGIIVSGNCFRTVENALLYNLAKSMLPDALSLPRPAHRLDALTSGLLIIAKTNLTRIMLGDMFAKHQILKTYQAIVSGKTPLQDTITSPLNDKNAITKFITLKQVYSLRNEWLSLLELKPETGRTHQLRIHLSQSGFPILGDKLYGTQGHIFKGKGLFLAATALQFIHPVTAQQIILNINPPAKFHIHLNRVENR
ncbi:MAG: RluA family pseudouridine synthase [Candidatus Cloacimonetes bacterium]|nr:RluA family pseudouridine synthase [Candidatus Cloacimonadota bacterium]